MNKIVVASVAASIPTIAPAEAMQAVDPNLAATIHLTPHPDAELIELGREFERLLAIEKPLEKEHERLSKESARLHRIKLGCDPEATLNDEAYHAIWKEAGDDRAKWNEWRAASDAADEETGRSRAWHKWNKAHSRTYRVGKKILKIQPETMAGLLVRVRVIETHDEILKVEPDQQLLKEIRNFAKRAA